MTLGERVRKFFLKLSLAYLPLLGAGTLAFQGEYINQLEKRYENVREEEFYQNIPKDILKDRTKTPLTERLEEYVDEAAREIVLTGKIIAYVPEKEPNSVRFLNPETNEKKHHNLGQRVVMISGTEGFVAAISGTSLKAKIDIIDVARNASVFTHDYEHIPGTFGWHDSLLAFEDNTLIFVHDARTNKRVFTLASKRPRDNAFLGWTTNGQLIVFSNRNSLTLRGFKDIYLDSLDGRTERLTRFNQGWDNAFFRDVSVYAGTAGVLGLLGLLGMIARHRLRKKNPPDRHKGLGLILDYPEIASAALAGGVFAYATGWLPQEGTGTPLFNALCATTYAASAVAVGALGYTACDAFSRIRSPILKHVLYAFKNRKHHAKNPLLEKEFALQTLGDPAERVRIEGQLLYEQGKIVDAAQKFSAYIQHRKRLGVFEEAVALDWAAILGTKFLAQFVKAPKNASIAELLNAQFWQLNHYHPSGIRSCAKRILAHPACTDPDRLLQSLVLDSAGEEKMADTVRDEVLPRILNNPDPAKVASNLVYVKAGRKDILEGEASLLSRAGELGRKYDFEAARTFRIYPYRDEHCLIEMFSDGKLLYDIQRTRPDQNIAREAHRVQAVLHAKLAYNGRSGLDAYLEKLRKRSPCELPKAFLSAAQNILKDAWAFQARDCDGHQENRHWNTSRQITVYDLEDRGSGPVAYDHVKCSRQGKNVFGPKEERDLFEEIAQKYNSLADADSLIPEERLAEFVWKTSPFAALSHAWWAQGEKPEKFPISLQFLENARNDLVWLKENELISREEYTVVGNEMQRTTDAWVRKNAREPPTPSRPAAG